MPPRTIDEFTFQGMNVRILDDQGVFKAVAFPEKGGKQEVDICVGDTVEEVSEKIKQAVFEASDQYFGVNGALNMFLEIFPRGFSDPLYLEWEREYKDKAIAYAHSSLSEEAFETALSGSVYEEIVEAAVNCMKMTNLVDSRWEQPGIIKLLSGASAPSHFVPLLSDLLYGSNFETAMKAMVAYLKPSGNAKWPFLTYFPFILFPSKHMFLKPKVAEDCAERVGHDLQYESEPNMVTYQSMLDLTQKLAKGFESLAPRDNVDIQTVIWAIGSKGYSKLAEKARKEHGL